MMAIDQMETNLKQDVAIIRRFSDSARVLKYSFLVNDPNIEDTYDQLNQIIKNLETMDFCSYLITAKINCAKIEQIVNYFDKILNISMKEDSDQGVTDLNKANLLRNIKSTRKILDCMIQCLPPETERKRMITKLKLVS